MKVKVIVLLILFIFMYSFKIVNVHALCCDTQSDGAIICSNQAIACADSRTRCDTTAECDDLIRNPPYNALNNPASYFFSSWINAIKLNRDLMSISGIINTLFPYFFIIAGLILFFMLISGGFQLLLSGANPKGAEAGKQRLTAAVIGFLVIFASYWIVQIIEIIFGIKILGN